VCSSDLQAAEFAHLLGLKVNAGHGLTYQNVGPVARLPHMEDLNIGHNIVARAVMVGMGRAVSEMIQAMRGHKPKIQPVKEQYR
jgi:pyridoxine 5-phosphate synthase